MKNRETAEVQKAEDQAIRLWMMHGDAPVPLGGYAAILFFGAVGGRYYGITSACPQENGKFAVTLTPTKKLKKLIESLS